MRIQKRSTGLRRLLFVAAALGLLTPATLLAQKPTYPDKPAPKQERKVGDQITDGWITMKVHAQYVTEDALDGSDIDVDTTNGQVTLIGTVRTEAGRARAVSIAKATDGVKGVNDKLRIAKGDDATAEAKEAGREAAGTAGRGARRVNDGWIKSKIYAQFLTEDTLEDSDIDVDVKAGVVTLNGTVVTAAGRTRAVAVAKATDGVKNVKDSLKVAKQ